jgi:hypothetical protein
MSPKFIMTVLFICLGFFLVLLSAGTPLSQRIAVSRAATAQRENPTPENMQAVKQEQHKVTRRQYVICGLAVLNLILIIVYGALQQGRGVRTNVAGSSRGQNLAASKQTS